MQPVAVGKRRRSVLAHGFRAGPQRASVLAEVLVLDRLESFATLRFAGPAIGWLGAERLLVEETKVLHASGQQ